MSSPPIAELTEHTEFVRALARSLLADPHRADDVAQDALLIAVERGAAGIRRPRAWLGMVTRNLVRRQFRSERRRARREERASTPESTSSAAELAERLDTSAMLVQAVRELREPFRETVILRFFDNLKPAEIARRQGVPAPTVRGRLSRALAMLRARLDAEHGNDRRAWALALLPLATRRARASVAIAAAAGLVAIAVLSALMFSPREPEAQPKPMRSAATAAAALDQESPAPSGPTARAGASREIANDATVRRFRTWRADLEYLFRRVEGPKSLREILATKGVDWDRVKAETIRQFASLEETSRVRSLPDEMADRAGFYGVLRSVIYQLRDSQAELDVDRTVWDAWRKNQPVFHPVGLELQPGAFGTVLVANVDPKRGYVSPVAMRGVGHAATILASVNGVDAAKYFERRARRRLTEEGRESTAARAYIEALADLEIAEGDTMELEFHELASPVEARKAYLALPPEKRASAVSALTWKVTRVTLAASDCTRTRNRRNFRFRRLRLPPLTESIDSGVWFGRLESGYGFVLYQGVSNTGEQAFAHALNALSDCPGLVIDVRVNSGGGSGGIGVFDRSRGLWDKPVAVLIGPKAMGAAETEIWKLRAMRDRGDCEARFFGRRTAGSTGKRTNFELPSGFASGRFVYRHWMEGTARIDGAGIEPDETIDQDVVDLSFGIDSCVSAAERWLDAKTARTELRRVGSPDSSGK